MSSYQNSTGRISMFSLKIVAINDKVIAKRQKHLTRFIKDCTLGADHFKFTWQQGKFIGNSWKFIGKRFNMSFNY